MVVIIELAIGAGLVAGASFVYRALKKPGPKTNGAKKPKKSPKNDAPPTPTGPRGLKVGDVLLYLDNELWLAGCFDLDEEGFVARVFRTPGAATGWVVQLDEHAKDLAMVDETDEVPGGSVPAELPIDGMRVSLRSRHSVKVAIRGSELPPASDKGELVIMGGPGGRILFVLDFAAGDRLALAGKRIGHEMIDVLPGGDEEQD